MNCKLAAPSLVGVSAAIRQLLTNNPQLKPNPKADGKVPKYSMS